MLLTLQYPILDIRPFIAEGCKQRYVRPSWPLPEEQVEFMRLMGKVIIRPSGGIAGIGESRICQANRAIRFDDLPPYSDETANKKVYMHWAFRRFFFDGLATGKFNLGIAAFTPKGGQAIALNRVLEALLQKSVFINGPHKTAQQVQLGDAANLLASLYLASSSRCPGMELQDGWVQGISPCILIEMQKEDRKRFKVGGRYIPVEESARKLLAYFEIPYKNKKIPCWVINRSVGAYPQREIRHLRGNLARLYCDKMCLMQALRLIPRKHIGYPPFSEQSDNLQTFISKAARRISNDQTRVEEYVSHLARTAFSHIERGEYNDIQEALINLNIRPAVHQEASTVINHYYTVETQGGDFVARDKVIN